MVRRVRRGGAAAPVCPEAGRPGTLFPPVMPPLGRGDTQKTRQPETLGQGGHTTTLPRERPPRAHPGSDPLLLISGGSGQSKGGPRVGEGILGMEGFGGVPWEEVQRDPGMDLRVSRGVPGGVRVPRGCPKGVSRRSEGGSGGPAGSRGCPKWVQRVPGWGEGFQGDVRGSGGAQGVFRGSSGRSTGMSEGLGGDSGGVRAHLKSGRLSCSFFRARLRVM